MKNLPNELLQVFRDSCLEAGANVEELDRALLYFRKASAVKEIIDFYSKFDDWHCPHCDSYRSELHDRDCLYRAAEKQLGIGRTDEEDFALARQEAIDHNYYLSKRRRITLDDMNETLRRLYSGIDVAMNNADRDIENSLYGLRPDDSPLERARVVDELVRAGMIGPTVGLRLLSPIPYPVEPGHTINYTPPHIFHGDVNEQPRTIPPEPSPQTHDDAAERGPDDPTPD